MAPKSTMSASTEETSENKPMTPKQKQKAYYLELLEEVTGIVINPSRRMFYEATKTPLNGVVLFRLHPRGVKEIEFGKNGVPEKEDLPVHVLVQILNMLDKGEVYNPKDGQAFPVSNTALPPVHRDRKDLSDLDDKTRFVNMLFDDRRNPFSVSSVLEKAKSLSLDDVDYLTAVEMDNLNRPELVQELEALAKKKFERLQDSGVTN